MTEKQKAKRTVALWIAGLSFLWCVIDINIAKTMLVTPLVISWAGFIVGMIVGIWVGYAVGDAEEFKINRYNRVPSRRATIILFCLLGLIWGGIVGNQALWRVANTVLFWGSDAPVTIASFPIREVSVPRGGPVVSIGSAGEHDALPISKGDLQLLRGADRLRRPWRYCLSLRRQEQGSAVRVWLPRRPRLTSNTLTVMRCPTNVQWI